MDTWSTVNAIPVSAALERLAETDRLQDVQEIVRVAVRQVAQADGATFVLRDGDRCFYADEDAISPLWKGQRFPITECISGWAMLHREVAIVPDIACDDRIPLAAYRPTFVRSLVMVPVAAGDAPAVAALGAYWQVEQRVSARAVEGLRALAGATATALERLGLDGAPFLPTAMRAAEAPSPA